MERFMCNKTENALISAFFQLLNEQHYSKITIREICEKAQVERSTFYRYFDCKEAFLEFVAKTAVQTDLKPYQKMETKDVERTSMLFERIIHNMSRYLATDEREKRLNRRAHRTTDMPKIVNYEISRCIETHFRGGAHKHLNVSPTMLAQFVSAGMLQLMLYQYSAVGEEQTKRAEEVDQFLQALIRSLSYNENNIEK